jgi:hypothetical protein
MGAWSLEAWLAAEDPPAPAEAIEEPLYGTTEPPEPAEVEELESLVEPEATHGPAPAPTVMLAYGKGKYTWVLLGVRGVGWFTTGQTAWSGGGTGKPLTWAMVRDLVDGADWVVEVVRDAPITNLDEWRQEIGDGYG